MQLDLFDSIFKELTLAVGIENLKVNWSYSKMQAFRDCPRKFYYLYYGSKKRNAKAEPLKEKLIELSKLSNKYMVQGNLIHQLVSIYFRQAKKGEVWDLNRLTNFGLMIIEEIIAYNNAVKSGIPETPKFPKPILKELYYSTVSANDIKIEIIDIVQNCLNSFWNSEEYTHLKYGGTKPSSKIEGDTSFLLNNTISVDGKVDIAFLDQRHLIIADWKTGKKELEDTSLQLLVYALWARQLTEWSFDSIEIQKAYLATGVLEKLEFSELHIERAKAKIMQDGEMLKEMDQFGKHSVKEAFAMHRGKNCRLCPFEEICNSK
ncbi:MAG: PD-(D/E)XK nuclease family protein [Chitinophagaceae bacterium]